MGRLAKNDGTGFRMDLEKTMSGILRRLSGAATAEKYRISDFRETPKDQS